MGTTQLSRMIRVRNEIAESVGQLNELCRTGNVPEIVKSLDTLIQSLKRGESFGDRLTSNRLTQLEDLVVSLGNGAAIAPTAAVEELTMGQLCEQFDIHSPGLQAQWEHKSVEQWLSERTGWKYVGGDRFISAG